MRGLFEGAVYSEGTVYSRARLNANYSRKYGIPVVMSKIESDKAPTVDYLTVPL